MDINEEKKNNNKTFARSHEASNINGIVYPNLLSTVLIFSYPLGRPMKLIYYVAPYDLLNKRRKAAHDMTIKEITDNELGHSVTVAIESSTPHKLQTIPLNHHIKTQDGKRYDTLTFWVNEYTTHDYISNFNNLIAPTFNLVMII